MRVGSLLILWVLAFCSCRRGAELADQSPVRGFPFLGEATPQSLSAEKKKSVRDRQAMEMELKWLVLRQKLVAARIEVESAREAELKLALDMARYGDMEERLPGKRGFIEAGQRKAWESRLLFKSEERERAQTVVRLLLRDMKDLEGKLSHRGFVPPLPLEKTVGESLPEGQVP